MNDEQLFSGKIVVSKQTAPHVYMKLILEIELEINRSNFKALILRALKELFGEAGRSIDVDVLCYSTATGEAIIKVPSSGVVQVWSSLTWYSNYSTTRCRFTVEKVSPYLVSLSKQSRHYRHKTVDV